MCGIVGGLSLQPFSFLDEPGRLDRAIDSLAHRGPDDRGALRWDDGRAFLGHRRLSIIDLAGGHQPLASECGRIHLIYNGEIYNHRRLRGALEGRGHAFRTRSDGETALHLYEEDAGAFERGLDGMFAIAVLDQPRRRLTLVRDRLGIKPLYYAWDGARLLFASELKAIVALLARRPEICRAALRDYLHWKYIPAPRTIYDGVFELPPAHRLVAEASPESSRLEVCVERYWRPDYGGAEITDEREAIERLDQELRRSVESHLEADVEIGALLSGGVDSSLVVALAATVSGRRIKTFSVGFREPGFDQLPYARTLAERYNTEHHEEYVELDPLTIAPQLVAQFDQPFADSSALACYAVCKTAARHVKVALTGDGGDETFAGYKRYQDLLSALGSASAPRRWWNGALFAGGALLFTPEAKFLQRCRAAALAPLDEYVQRERMCTDWLIRKLLGQPADDGDDAYVARRQEALAAGWPPLAAIQYADLSTYLPGDILTKVDRTSMACGLECRVPLLDHAVTELSARLSPALLMHDGEGKYILKRVAERYVPRELIYRKKRGFRVPIRRWFKRGLLAQTAALLRGGAAVRAGWLRPEGVEWVLRQQARPWMNLSSCLWALLMLELWARENTGPG